MHFMFMAEDNAPNRNTKQVEIVGVQGWDIVLNFAMWLMAQCVFGICTYHHINPNRPLDRLSVI